LAEAISRPKTRADSEATHNRSLETGGGSQNIIFVASGYLKQGALYRLGLLTTIAFMAIYLVIGTPWLFFIAS